MFYLRFAPGYLRPVDAARLMLVAWVISLQ
jgi:hypothetical protein